MAVDALKLQDFLVDDLGISRSDVGADALLFSTGVVDSFALVTLMTYLERETGRFIEPGDITLDNFDSISRIVNYLKEAA